MCRRRRRLIQYKLALYGARARCIMKKWLALWGESEVHYRKMTRKRLSLDSLESRPFHLLLVGYSRLLYVHWIRCKQVLKSQTLLRCLYAHYTVIFVHAPGGVNTPHLRDDTPHPSPPPNSTQCNFSRFLMFFNVNLHFSHVYTSPNICLYPPNFKFLEITLSLQSAAITRTEWWPGHDLWPGVVFLWYFPVLWSGDVIWWCDLVVWSGDVIWSHVVILCCDSVLWSGAVIRCCDLVLGSNVVVQCVVILCCGLVLLSSVMILCCGPVLWSVLWSGGVIRCLDPVMWTSDVIQCCDLVLCFVVVIGRCDPVNPVLWSVVCCNPLFVVIRW